ncbi:3-oxo-tetronate kinase [Curtobacterium sp. MCSS17_016]|uniref:3-oxo-tetronate kinase n=1 Tax=Curtobacterium sp. MCSS17_016 TaxID=2175644 RepID=UPI000DA8E573|nr:3-oxo-tetronate kinase [Curtobacterium sp. MCSS17_016]WIE79175.1 four-carbon acid sugar kinase family protein [Curtobacterium sp. MCSS17_016]
MIGAIADDFTGGTDVAVAFRRAGLRTAIVFGVPDTTTVVPADADAVVVALKSRTTPVEEAVRESLRTGEWLLERGADQLYFKYCSTFDSRAEGNIGQVSDALAGLTSAQVVAVVPSSPEHGRTQYQGHLFVHDTLLSESPMRHHPLTPMTNSRIVEVLAAQTTEQVALVHHDRVRAGASAVVRDLATLEESGIRYAVIDAVSDEDLSEIGVAVAGARLVTGAAGLAGGLGRARAAQNHAHEVSDADPIGEVRTAVLAGSCSARTLQQLDRYREQQPGHFIDALAEQQPAALAAAALTFYDTLPVGTAPVLYSSVPPEILQRVQAELGVNRASAILEEATGLIARGLIERGVRRLVVAGGETSGAVVTALEVRTGVIGREVAPGVPWIYTQGTDAIAVLLKSGNFGSSDFLLEAVQTGRVSR